jgi:branched-chain amino acid transport system permease protein
MRAVYRWVAGHPSVSIVMFFAILPFIVPYKALATQVLVYGLFALGFNLLYGYTGLLSFGHAAYFGLGAYGAGIALAKLGWTSIWLALALGVVAAGVGGAIVGFFALRRRGIYFAMLTLAFAQIVWAICFKWNEVTGGEQGMPEIPYPSFDWVERLATWVPLAGGYRTSEYFYFLTLVLVAASLWVLRRIVGSPFGRMLTTIRENPERAEFIGVNVRRYELAAFVLAGIFAGLAGGLFGIFNRGVFPDFAYWTKSSEVLIMTLLGGMGTFAGPSVGALVLLWLNQQIVSYTQYWPLVLGTILVLLLFVFPGGLAGAAESLLRALRRDGRERARA